MSEQNRVFGLIGKTLHYSFSQKYFAKKFEDLALDHCRYELFELENIEEFLSLKLTPNLAGLNVTIPYKKEIIPYLDDLDPVAKKIQAVNTIKFQDGKLIGYNTDIIGFTDSLKKLIGRKKVENALILGTGGASFAIKYALETLGIEYKVVSRSSGDIRYDGIDKDFLRSHRLIINSTPLGTYPDVDLAPNLPYQHLQRKHLLFDLVYNPEKTLFLDYGVRKGCSVTNGYPMLVGQAEAAWNIWNTD